MVDPNVWWNRLGAASGLVAVIVMVIGAGTTGSLDGDVEPSDSAATIAQELADHSDIGPVITLIGLLLLLWFIAYLRRHLAMTADSWLTDVFFGGGLIYVAMIAGSIALELAISAVPDSGSDAQIAKTLFILQWDYAWLFGPPVIAVAGAAAAMSIRFGALPKWLGWLAVLVAFTGLMPWIGVLALLVWSAIVSVSLLVQQARSPAAAEAASAS